MTAHIIFLLLFGSPLAEKAVTLEREQAPLRQILNDIYLQTGIRFSFADDNLQGFRFAIDQRTQPVKHILQNLSQGSNLKFIQRSPKRYICVKDRNIPTRTIKGKLRFQAQNGVYPVVYIKGTQRIGLVDTNGFFTLNDLPCDQAWTLKIAAPGYIERQIKLIPESANSLDITLVKQPEHKETILVQPSSNLRALQKSPFGALRANHQALDNPRMPNFEDLALRIPGLSLPNPGDSGMSVRGAEPGENLVLLDGIKLYEVGHALGHHSAINTEMLQEMLIYRSGSPAKYGDRLAGVFDMSTRTPSYGEISGSVGVETELAHATFSFPLLGGQFLIGARKSLDASQSEVVYKNVFEETFNRDFEEYEEYDFVDSSQSLNFEDIILKWNSKELAWGNFQFTSFFGEDQIEDSIGIVDGDITNPYHRTAGKWGNRGASLRFQNTNSDRSIQLNVTYSSYFTRFDFDAFWENPPYVNEDLTTGLEEMSLGWNYERYFESGNVLRAGINQSRLDSNYTYDQDGTLLENIVGSRYKLSGYLDGTWFLPFNIRLQSGLRFSQENHTKGERIDPRVALDWEFFPNWSSNLTWGKYHQNLLRSDDTVQYYTGTQSWYVPQNGIESAESQQWQLGIHYKSELRNAGLEYYYRDWEGTLGTIFNPITRRWNFKQELGTFRGLDFWVGHQFSKGALQARYSYQDGDSRQKNDGHISASYTSSRERPHYYQASGNFWVGKMNVRADYIWASGLPYSQPNVSYEWDPTGFWAAVLQSPEIPNTKRLPSYETLNMDCSIPVEIGTGSLEFALQIRNVANEQSVSHRYMRVDKSVVTEVDVLHLPRTVYLNATYRF